MKAFLDSAIKVGRVLTEPLPVIIPPGFICRDPYYRYSDTWKFLTDEACPNQCAPCGGGDAP